MCVSGFQIFKGKPFENSKNSNCRAERLAVAAASKCGKNEQYIKRAVLLWHFIFGRFRLDAKQTIGKTFFDIDVIAFYLNWKSPLCFASSLFIQKSDFCSEFCFRKIVDTIQLLIVQASTLNLPDLNNHEFRTHTMSCFINSADRQSTYYTVFVVHTLDTLNGTLLAIVGLWIAWTPLSLYIYIYPT